MNILLIEDEALVGDLLVTALKDWHQKTVWVTTKKEALSKIEEDRFDMTLLDIMLPDGFGYDIIPEIKRLQPEINIITMTGYNTPEMEKTIREFGISYYMAKPVNLKELKHIIDHFVTKQKKEEVYHG